jgi:hypothetical protein
MGVDVRMILAIVVLGHNWDTKVQFISLLTNFIMIVHRRGQ